MPRRQFLDAVGLSGGDDVVICMLLLEHRPHRADIVARITPVTTRLKIAERDVILEPETDARCCMSNLAREEVEGTPRRFVVVQDSGRRMQSVAPSVASRDEMRVRLGDSVRCYRSNGRSLALWGLSGVAEDLT